MSNTVKAGSMRLELDNAFKYAVTLAWEDLMKITEPCSVRVEYSCEPGTAPGTGLDHLKVWSVKAKGYQDLVCDYWTWTDSAHQSGASFSNRHHSDKLAQTIDFIMKKQYLFTRRAGASRDGWVLIYPPDADDRTEAATCMRVVQAPEAPDAPAQPDARRQDEEARSRMDDEGGPTDLVALSSRHGRPGE